jgi:hypothetical protein
LNVYVCMYVCIYMYIYVYICIYVCICVYVFMYLSPTSDASKGFAVKEVILTPLIVSF